MDGDRSRAAGGGGGERGGQAEVGQRRGVDAVGQAAQVGGRLVQVGAELAEEFGGAGGAGVPVLAGQPRGDGGGEQGLLRSVVQVALDAASFGVRGGDNPVPGRLQLRGLVGDLLPGVAQRLVGGRGLPQGAGQPGAVMPQQQRHRAGHDRGERDDDRAGEPAGNLGADRRQRAEPAFCRHRGIDRDQQAGQQPEPAAGEVGHGEHDRVQRGQRP